ncbi:F-box protein At3g56470-like isoform X2 [Apium graveolens]|uniref:F-box protein At3g56470-like isoform X2 n=1 Tax=Apium graveolens TaxID=4045 RepID=UPI003D78F819
MMTGARVVGLLTFSIPLAVIITRYYLSHHNNLKKTKPPEQQQVAEQVEIKSTWSELDSNLLSEILGRLSLTDQARFRAVCKTWFAAPSITLNSSFLLSPWWVEFNRKTYEFELYDTSLSSPSQLASIQHISFTKFGIPAPSHFDVKVTPDHDWFFISVIKHGLFSWTHTFYFLVFSPLTKKIIKLPKFHQSSLRFSLSFNSVVFSLSQYGCFRFRPAFSARPDSPDCVFFLLDTHNASHNFVILTCRVGDKEWTARQFKPVPEFVPAHCRPVYLGGMLYIVSPFGQLASFDFVNEDFWFDNLILDDLFVQNIFSKLAARMFSLNGELMILFFRPISKKNVNLHGIPCLKRYDWSTKLWIPVSTLGDKALFVGQKINGLSEFCTEVRRNNGILSDKIYQVFDGGCFILSVQNGNLVEYKSITSNLLEDGCAGADLPEYKYACGITTSDKTYLTFWLEPPCIHSSNNQEMS